MFCLFIFLQIHASITFARTVFQARTEGVCEAWKYNGVVVGELFIYIRIFFVFIYLFLTLLYTFIYYTSSFFRVPSFPLSLLLFPKRFGVFSRFAFIFYTSSFFRSLLLFPIAFPQTLRVFSRFAYLSSQALLHLVKQVLYQVLPWEIMCRTTQP